MDRKKDKRVSYTTHVEGIFVNQILSLFLSLHSIASAIPADDAIKCHAGQMEIEIDR